VPEPATRRSPATLRNQADDRRIDGHNFGTPEVEVAPETLTCGFVTG
jgi:hypothetical protein